MADDQGHRHGSGRYCAPIGRDIRRDYGSEEDLPDELDFGCSRDSDGSYCSADEEEVIGTQAVDYSSLEMLQQQRDNGMGAPRGCQPAPTPISGAPFDGIAANSTRGRGSRGGPRYNGILRTTRGVRQDNAGFSTGSDSTPT
jgi:hypothetical protein